MSPSLNSFGSNPSVSQLVWDTDLVIPDGKAIESASGEVGIVGDVSISGSLITDGAISSGGDVTAGEELVGDNAVLNGKKFVLGVKPGDASITLPQIPSGTPNYTSADFTITNGIEGVQYVVPPISYFVSRNGDTPGAVSTFTLEAKLPNGTYTPITSATADSTQGVNPATTPEGIIPGSATALRYTLTSDENTYGGQIQQPLTNTLTPIPVY